MAENISEHYAADLAKNFGLPGSERLIRILETILSPEEIQLLLHTSFSIAKPTRTEELASEVNRGLDVTRAKLEDLYRRGIVAVGAYNDSEPGWYVPNLALIMDSTHWDPLYRQYGEEYYDLWKAFVNEELLPLMQNPQGFGLHVVPVGEAIPTEGTRQVLNLESAQGLIEEATRIVVLDCPCRTRERRCDSPLETCISLNEFADYFRSRQIGREIDRQEALAILANCEEHGLVHQVPTGEHPDVICNCCSCCCIILRAVKITKSSASLVGSGYHPVLDPAKCGECLSCVEVCPFDALVAEDGKPALLADRCLGCGQCVRVCPEGALELVEVELPARTSMYGTLRGGFQWSHVYRNEESKQGIYPKDA